MDNHDPTYFVDMTNPTSPTPSTTNVHQLYYGSTRTREQEQEKEESIRRSAFYFRALILENYALTAALTISRPL
jgi:hypothetical protein